MMGQMTQVQGRVRAAALPLEERRSAIVAATLPLFLDQGGAVTTREIAQAAGIAEGTIFRVFPDKKSLLMAAAEEAINPSGGQELFDKAMADVTDLRDQIVLSAQRVLDRMLLTMSVMVAVRPHLIQAFHEDPESKKHMGPPAFVLKAQEDLHRRLTRLFEPHRGELAVEPDVPATALRSLIFGASRPELGMKAVLTADQIADIVLGGVLRRDS